MASRRIEDLRDEMRVLAEAFVKKCAEAGIEVLIYGTLRTVEEQAKLWRMGRSRSLIESVIGRLAKSGKGWVAALLRGVGPQPGNRVVTNALPGESAHNYGYGFDAVPLIHGKPAWNDESLLNRMGEIGKSVGLNWAGDWKRFRERVHFELPGWRERGKKESQ
jgi:peptidoglycan L-alanyl-D-glutamate endopeptidase CwlK